MYNFAKNSFVIIKTPKIGNIKNNSYCSGWIFGNNDNLDFVLSDDGNYVICVCKKDFEFKKSIELRTKILHDTMIEFNYELINEKSNIMITIIRNGNKINIYPEQNRVEKDLLQNDEIIIKMQSENGCCGEIIGIINDIKFTLNEYENEEIKIDANNFIFK
jgi:hypothetical protein